jgi:hypothetical protein
MAYQGQPEAGHHWLLPIILSTWEASIKRIKVQSQALGKQFSRPYLEKPIT